MSSGGAELSTSAPPILIPEEHIQQRVRELAREINQEYQGLDLLLVSMLGGSLVLVADLIRQLEVPFGCAFLSASSYGSRAGTSGEARITLDTAEPVEGRHLLVCDGAVVSGLTLKYVVEWLKLRGAASVRTCALLVKRDLQVDLQVEYAGFQIGDEFAVGYGIAHGGRYRGLPYVGVLPART